MRSTPTFLLEEGHLLQQDVLDQGQVLIAAVAPDTQITVLLSASAPSLLPAATGDGP